MNVLFTLLPHEPCVEADGVGDWGVPLSKPNTIGI